jgi:hypothetical protein
VEYLFIYIYEIFKKKSLTYTTNYAAKNTRRKRRPRAVVKFKNACMSLIRDIKQINKWYEDSVQVYTNIYRISLKSHKTIFLYERYNV